MARFLKLTYLIISILMLNISSASLGSLQDCGGIMQQKDMSQQHVMNMDHDAMKSRMQHDTQSVKTDDCCGESHCPMTSCSTPSLVAPPMLAKTNEPTSQQVLDRYKDLPLLSVHSILYRPPIQL